MLSIYYDKVNDEIHWSSAETGGYIKPMYDNDGCICYFDVYSVSEYDGEEILDGHCNTLPDAIAQLEMVSGQQYNDHAHREINALVSMNLTQGRRVYLSGGANC